ncbi:MAG: DUF805 domain-containing protein [bacterium]
MKYYLSAFKKYATFCGRASRKEYWMFILLNAIVVLCFSIISISLDDKSAYYTLLSILFSIYYLFILIPSVALTSRRLHDTDHSGWFQLIIMIPIVGAIFLIVLLAGKGQTTENKYGTPNV